MYSPTSIPADAPRGLRGWLAQQLREIADSLRAPSVSQYHLVPLAEEPSRIRDGAIVYADGTNWNPGAGPGVYARESGAWVKL